MNLEQIDTSTTAGKRRVMELAEQGRKIVYRVRPADSHAWDDHAKWGEPDWDWLHIDYAIISEPVGPEEVWATVINGCVDAGPYTFELNAVRRAQDYGGEVVKYIRADLAGEKG